MEKVVKTVKPVYEGFWHQHDSDILNRLNEAAKKLKDRGAEMKKDAINETSQRTKCPLLTNASPVTAQLDIICLNAAKTPYSMT